MFAMVQKCFCTTPFVFEFILFFFLLLVYITKLSLSLFLVSQETYFFFFVFDFPFGLLGGKMWKNVKSSSKENFIWIFRPYYIMILISEFLWTKEMVKIFCNNCTFSFFSFLRKFLLGLFLRGVLLSIFL